MNRIYSFGKIAPLFLLLWLFSPSVGVASDPFDPLIDDLKVYECLPPISLNSFPDHLIYGSPEFSLDWSSFFTLKHHPQHRLQLVRVSGDESTFLAHLLIMIGDDGMDMDLQSLTIHPKYMHRSEIISGNKSSKDVRVATIVNHLRVLNRQYQIFVDINRPVMSGLKNYRSYIFRDLLKSGALIFNNDEMSMVLSRDYKYLSVCAAQGIGDLIFNHRKLAQELFKMLSNKELVSLLKCEGILLSR